MTNTPGEPEDPSNQPPDPPGEQPGYWQQQADDTQPGQAQPPYGQPPYGQPPYGQPQPGQPQPGQPQPGQPQPGQPVYGQPQYGAPQYGQQPGYPVAYAPDHPKATTCLVLGILGVVLCQVIAPFAWQMGKRTVSEIDASQGRLGGRGSAQAGYVLGIVGTVLLGLFAIYILFVIVLVLGASAGNEL